ncbi:hypothetical protein BT96DRAFT_1003293 [Gymnopus androsaceus JB14]|uniref:Uncharacterized protein n=1 Tax=Gymnopus androsaceus JB14 TaxID=1447944 RepID=A0A6A4GWB4_9AGAR|nr:hypothetical protein BT96DRAFT_1003293 [Gymnopus androsaceus JB14]
MLTLWEAVKTAWLATLTLNTKASSSAHRTNRISGHTRESITHIEFLYNDAGSLLLQYRIRATSSTSRSTFHSQPTVSLPSGAHKLKNITSSFLSPHSESHTPRTIQYPSIRAQRHTPALPAIKFE